MPIPKLQSPDWQAALSEAAPHLERFQEVLNRVSDDIRSLEKYLLDTGFRIDTRISLGDGESLGWSEIGEKWRLVHWTPHPMENDDKGTALIETPVATRWRVSEMIPSLLRNIAVTARTSNVPFPVSQKKNQISPPESSGPLTDDDIPF